MEEEFVKVGPNGRPIRPVLTTEERLRKDFLERLTELETENDAAFRVLNKRNLPGVRPPRIATMRKFWAQLENLSHYWDASLDDYFQIPVSGRVGQGARVSFDADDAKTDEEASPSSKSPKRQRVDNGQDVMLSGTATTVDGSNDEGDDVVDTVMTDDEPSQTEEEGNDVLPTTEEAPQKRGMPRYKGRRIGTGRDMPDRFRSDALLAFVEGCAWPFNSTVIPPRRTPVVRFMNLNIPIKQLACVYRLPNDGARRRAGWIQGPIIGLQGRPEIEFAGEKDKDEPKQEDAVSERATSQDNNNGTSGSSGNPSTAEKMDIDVPDQEAANATADGFRKPSLPSLLPPKPRAIKKKPPPVVEPTDRARLDVLREIGLLLEIAQERYREGKTEDKPGVGKWWTEKPRFGGGKAGGDNEKADAPSSPEKKTASAVRVEFPGATASKPVNVVPRPAATASPTTLDFSSLRNKNGASGTTTVNNLGPKSLSPPTTTPEAPSTSTPTVKPATPIHPPMPPSSSSTSTSTSKFSPSIDPMLAAAATPSAAFANEIFSRYQRKERKSPQAMWEILRSPTPSWDAKTEYRAIGKDKSPRTIPAGSTGGDDGDSGATGSTSKSKDEIERSAKNHDAGKWDEVFIVSALNHHISILRLTVHDAYLEYLLTGTIPPSSSQDTPPAGLKEGEKGEGEKGHWSIPTLRRSEWFDLLDPKRRCEAFRALWGVMAYLNRGEEIW